MGCDEDAERPAFYATCPRCSGSDEECERCEGSGVAPFHRCPASMITPAVSALLDSYAAYDRHGTLPAEGGWMAQSRVWARWVRIIDAERAKIEEERRAKEKRKG